MTFVLILCLSLIALGFGVCAVCFENKFPIGGLLALSCFVVPAIGILPPVLQERAVHGEDAVISFTEITNYYNQFGH